MESKSNSSDSDTSTSDDNEDKHGDWVGFLTEAKILPGIDEDEEVDDDSNSDENGVSIDNDGGRFEAHLRYTRQLSAMKEKINNELLSMNVTIPIEMEGDGDNEETAEILLIRKSSE